MKVSAYFSALSKKFTSCKQIRDATGWPNNGVYTLWNKALTQRYNVSIVFLLIKQSMYLPIYPPAHLTIYQSINQTIDQSIKYFSNHFLDLI